MNKRIKQLLSAVLVIALMATLLVVPAVAADKTEVDVWDFGAEQLADTADYKFNNHLNVTVINGWYEGLVDKDGNAVEVKTGQTGNNFPHLGFTDVAGLSYRTGTAENPAYNHRLRTDNTALTRDSADTCTGDANDPFVEGDGTYHGILYSNSAANPAVHFELDCKSGDIITLIVSSNGTDSLINFTNADTEEVEASDVFTRASRTKMQTMTFHAKSDGIYNINSINEKLVVARIYRQHATPVTVSGSIAEAAGMPAGYSVVFTNTTTGAEIVIPAQNGKYSGTVLAPYSYDVTLKDANGFAVLNGSEVTVTTADAAVTNDLTIQAVDRVTVSGKLTGLDDAAKAKLAEGNLLFTPTGDGIVYVPEVTIEGDTYTVMVEKDMPTTVLAKKLNDWEITTQNITDVVYTKDTTLDLAFAKKAVYPVTITTTGMTAADLAGTQITFTNLHEAGETEDQTIVPFNPYSADNLTGAVYNYSYTFTGTTGVELRDGVYDVTVDDPHQKATANLVVNGGAATLTIPFNTPAPYVANGTHDFTPNNATLAKVDGISGPFKPHNSGHGLTGKGDMTISLGELSTITIAGCCYSQVNGTLLVPTAKAGGQDVTVEITKEGEANKTDPEYVISNVEGDVVVTFPADGSSYIHSIKVEPAVKSYPTEWDFGTWANDNKSEATFPSSVTNGLEIKGELKSHKSDYGAYMKNGSLGIPVSGPCEVIVSVGNSYDVKFPGDAEAQVAAGSVPKKTELKYTYTGEEGTVTVEIGGGATTYIDKISVVYPNFPIVPSKWDFMSGELLDQADDKVIQLQNGTATWNYLDIDTTDPDGGASGGKFSTKGRASGWAQFNKPAKVEVPIYGGVAVGEELEVVVSCYNQNYSINGTPATGKDTTYTVTVDTDHKFTITSDDAGGYLGSIEVKYPEGTLPEPAGDIVFTVGADKDFQTITEALAAAEQAKRDPGQRITIEIDPGDYEEQLYIKVKDLTLKNAKAAQATLELKDKGVNIGANEVRITWYYGHGYTYYSMTNGHRYNADVLAANKANGYASYENKGAGSTDDSYWNASVLIAAENFQAEGIIFENSFNQYVSAKSLEDVIVPQGAQAKEGNTPRASLKTLGDTKVQEKAYVERAGAVSIKSGSNIVFDNCAFISRQDTFYGNEGSKVACYGCDIYGGTDYIYGGMTLVAAKCNLLFNTSEDNNDVGYITAAQQKSSSTPGYLFWNCTVDSTTPGVNTASAYRSKPGYFGRPWETTGQALFYATDIKATDPVYFGVPLDKETAHSTSLITPTGWNSSLGGQSTRSEEMGTVEYYDDVNNSSKRVSWSTAVTTAPTVADFLGDWNPFEGKDMTIANQTPVTAPEAAKPITKLTIGQKAQDMSVGDTLDLTVTVEPADATDKTVDWTSSDLSVLTVDANGKVTAVGGGAAKIKVSSKNHMVNAEILLTVVIPVDSVTLNKNTINMGAGRTTTLTATVAPANATTKDVTWSSADPTVATVDANGRVKGVAAGETVITATTKDGGKTATCAVTIKGVAAPPEADSLTLAPASVNVNVGAKKTVTATVTGYAGKSVYAVSDDTSVATVAVNGKTITVTGVAAGSTNVYVVMSDTAVTVATAKADPSVKVLPVKVSTASTPTGGSSSRPSDTDASGNTVKKTTDRDGTTTITVTSPEGEVIAKVVLPGTIPSVGYKFIDVPDEHWAAKSINDMAGLGMVKGVDDVNHIYDMKSNTTRGAVATILFRLSQGKAGIDNKFADVAGGAWYADAVAWAAKYGVVTGYNESTFGPNDMVTREQLALMLCRYAKLLGMTTSTTADLSSFSDSAAVSSWAAEAMNWAVASGVIKGKDNGTLDPTAAATRAEAACMIDRFIALAR